MTTSETSTAAAALHAGKYLIVVLAEEAYGIAVASVREIIRLQRITFVPQLPASVKGVINLRGRVIPVIDLRLAFGLSAETHARMCIVVVRVRIDDVGVLQLGLIVDSVEEVANIAEGEIEPAPQFGGAIRADYLVGIAKVKGQVKMLLDIDRVISADAMQTLSAGG
jgi:purine-binding chemotaxis protein CheW